MWVLAVLSSSAMVFYLGVGGIDTNRHACFDPSQGDSRWQRVLRDWLAEGEGRDPDDWTMAAAAGEFVLGRAVAGVSAECVKREAYHLKIWLAWSVAAGAGLAREIDEDLVLRFLTCRRDEFGNRGGTLKRYEDTLSSLTRFLHRKGALRSDPLADLGFRSPRDRRLERVLSIEELDSLVAALADAAERGDGPVPPCCRRQDLVLCKVLIATGMRAGELTGLRRSDFDPTGGTLAVTGKGSGRFAIRGRRLFVSDRWLMDELRAWAEACPRADGYLFRRHPHDEARRKSVV